MNRNNASSQENSSTNAGLKAITYICGVIASLCLIVSGLLVSVEVNIVNRSFSIIGAQSGRYMLNKEKEPAKANSLTIQK